MKSSHKLPEKQHKRFASRMKRLRKNSASLRRFGKSYKSGKYSASALANPDDEVEGDLEGPAVTTSSQDMEVCGKCGRGESDGILETLNIILSSNVLEWICCDSCSRWFHCICVDLDEAGDYSDVDWKCEDCDGQ